MNYFVTLYVAYLRGIWSVSMSGRTVDPTTKFLQVRKFKASELQLVVLLSSNHKKLDGS